MRIGANGRKRRIREVKSDAVCSNEKWKGAMGVGGSCISFVFVIDFLQVVGLLE
jgi:hypothetical protein